MLKSCSKQKKELVEFEKKGKSTKKKVLGPKQDGNEWRKRNNKKLGVQNENF